jgi:hypothetical protein
MRTVIDDFSHGASAGNRGLDGALDECEEMKAVRDVFDSELGAFA